MSKPVLREAFDSTELKPKIDTGYMDFLNRRITVRIHYPSGEVRRNKIKITMHTFTVKGMDYFIHTDAFYREGKTWYCDYYYGNPKPILFKSLYAGLAVASEELMQLFQNGKVTDQNDNVITYEDWIALPYYEKIKFPGVVEFDGRMLNKALNQKFTDNLWGNDGLFSGSGKVALFVIIGLGVAMGLAIYGHKAGWF